MKTLTYLLLALLLVSCKNEPVDINVMSFNIRFDNPDDSLNSWQYRKDVAAKIIELNKIDILGTQEVLHSQLEDLKERLPEYNVIGVGREDGKEKGEYSALLYNKNRFEEIKSGYFWLSETPEIEGSKGWDGACERIATWAILKDKKSEKQFFAINTHLDHVGKIAREEGVNLLLAKTFELSNGFPIIMTGDFNSTPTSDVVKHITDNNSATHLINSKDIAKTVSGTDWTFHGFGNVPLEKRQFIDYIFVSKNTEVKEFIVSEEKLDDIYLSDHKPIITKISF